MNRQKLLRQTKSALDARAQDSTPAMAQGDLNTLGINDQAIQIFLRRKAEGQWKGVLVGTYQLSDLIADYAVTLLKKIKNSSGT